MCDGQRSKGLQRRAGCVKLPGIWKGQRCGEGGVNCCHKLREQAGGKDKTGKIRFYPPLSCMP